MSPSLSTGTYIGSNWVSNTNRTPVYRKKNDALTTLTWPPLCNARKNNCLVLQTRQQERNIVYGLSQYPGFFAGPLLAQLRTVSVVVYIITAIPKTHKATSAIRCARWRATAFIWSSGYNEGLTRQQLLILKGYRIMERKGLTG